VWTGEEVGGEEDGASGEGREEGQEVGGQVGENGDAAAANVERRREKR